MSDQLTEEKEVEINICIKIQVKKNGKLSVPLDNKNKNIINWAGNILQDI